MQRPIYYKFNIWACIQTLNMTTKNYLDWFTGSGTSHIGQIGMLGSWAHGTFDSHQISYLGMYTSSKCDYQKLS